MVDFLEFPQGLHLLTRWQSGDAQAKEDLRRIFDDAIAGEYDANFSEPAPHDAVHVTGSVHMIALSILYDLYGVESAEYYKTDPDRYVRSNLIVSRMLGMTKLYLTWAIYAFNCEAVGQKMMYPDKFPPGADPDQVLINSENWGDLGTPDFDSGIPKIINDVLRVMERVTGMEPLLQISAPYSLAADIYGQEPLLADVVHEPDRVNALLDHLADKVIGPWCEHFFSKFPNGWVELSDASGSPFFIGPENCKNMSIRSMQRLISGQPWTDRVFDANYRGDYVTLATQKDRGGRRRAKSGAPKSGVDLLQLTELKHSVCQDFIMRLEADKVPLQFYQDQAIERGVPLTTGIGASQIDRNSLPDRDIALVEIRQTARDFVDAIKSVADAVELPADNNIMQPWPSHIYFEDISSQSEFEMIEIIGETVREYGAFDA